MNEWTGQQGSLKCPQVAGVMGYSLEERDSAPFMNNRPSRVRPVGWVQTAGGQFPALTHHGVRLSSGVSIPSSVS